MCVGVCEGVCVCERAGEKDIKGQMNEPIDHRKTPKTAKIQHLLICMLMILGSSN